MARKRRKTKAAPGSRAAVKFGPLENWVGFNLRMAQEAAFAAFSHLSREVGESPGRFANPSSGVDSFPRRSSRRKP